MSTPPTTDEASQEALAAKLRALLKASYDAERAYRLAADEPSSAGHRALFLRYAGLRAEHIAELRDELTRLANATVTTPPPEPSGLRLTIPGDEHAAVASCARLEGDAIKAYEDALGDRLPPPLEIVLRRQYTAIKEAYDAMSHLRGDRSPPSRPSPLTPRRAGKRGRARLSSPGRTS
jgi:hypothetical protein